MSNYINILIYYPSIQFSQNVLMLLLIDPRLKITYCRIQIIIISSTTVNCNKSTMYIAYNLVKVFCLKCCKGHEN